MQQNTHPVGTRDTRKKNELMYGILNETKINIVTHVIRGQSFYLSGEEFALNLTESHQLSFSKDQHWRSSHQKSYKQKQEKQQQKTPCWKFLLNYSLSGSPSFINYLFSIFWLWINLFSLWWRSNYLFSKK